MKAACVRLALVLALFVGWLGYEGYLVRAQKAAGGVVLSRPQLLVADLVVIGDVKRGSDEVTVREILSPTGPEEQRLAGKPIRVTNLEDCRPPPDGKANTGPDLKGDGDYLLPLQDLDPDAKAGAKRYRVAVIPPSPGFSKGTPRIYPATPEVRAQYRQLEK